MEIIFLIGLPGTGKTTWRKRFTADNPGYVIISTDDLLERWATAAGITYDEAWKSLYTKAAETTLADLKEALRNKKNIIIDRTNLVNFNQNPDPSYSKQVNLERQFLLDLTPTEYTRIAIVFEQPKDILEERRLQLNSSGKKIPAEVIDRMYSYYQPPAETEFDIISTPDQFAEPRQSLEKSNIVGTEGGLILKS